jgi:hypothetical protein
MIPRFMIAALCVLGPFTCVAHSVDINGEATYVSFSVPGALGTYPMSIDAAMEVAGYYNVSPTAARGFLRDADGTISTFKIPGAVLTIPESINARGDVTGFYTLPTGMAQGFLRYAAGRTVTFYPPAPAGGPPPAPVGPMEAQPISINEYDDIAGNYPVDNSFNGFARSASGVYNDILLDTGTGATAINSNGSVIGYNVEGEGVYDGYVWHPDGWSSLLIVPIPPQSAADCYTSTFPEGINAASTIVGWYNSRCNPVNTGFVLSPDGVYTPFRVPGTLVASPMFNYTSTDPHWLSIDQDGDITGSYTDAAGVQHGFVRNPYGTITSFDPPEGKQTTATSISDGGAIAGFYHYHGGGGPPVGFVRVPQ